MASIQTGIQLQDNFSSVMYGIISSVNLAVSAMDDMSQAMSSGIDTASLQGAREQLNQATIAADALNQALQDMGTPAVSQATQQQPIQWQSDNLNVFDGSGINRFRQEIQSTNHMLTTLNETQSRIEQTASGMDILPDSAANDISNVGTRIQAIQDYIQQIESNPMDIGVDNANIELERLRTQLNQAIQEQSALNSAIDSMDVSAANNAYLRLSQTISNTERHIRDNAIGPQQIQWQSDGMEVFNSTGAERFRQEIQSANNMLNNLNQTQRTIGDTALNLDILPSDARQDIMQISTRIRGIQLQMQRIEENPLDMNTSVANADLERLRTQLSQALNEQNVLNSALQNMDADAANNAYLRLSQTISSTERYIRDNISEQQQFNNVISEGTTHANTLVDTIKRVAGAYLTLQSLKGVVNASDELTQTTARLSLMNDGLQSTQELQDKIYLSAERARASYIDTASTVSKLGLLAEDAFSSTDEIIAFSELMNKSFKIGGADKVAQTAGMYQLTQAMASGRLQGDEYRSIIENAPLLAQSIEDYMINVQHAKGSMKDWAREGMLTADVIKAALFGSANEINAQFEKIPQTWSDVTTSLKNGANRAFQPVLQRINDMANSEAVQTFANNAITAMAMIASVVLNIFDLIGSVGTFIADNWSIIGPIVLGVTVAMGLYTAALAANTIAHGINSGVTAISTFATKVHAAALAIQRGATFKATAAQYGFNAALLACPVTWIIAAIIAFIAIVYAVTAAINQLTGTTNSAMGIICGTIAVAAAAIWNTILGLVNFGIGIGVELHNLIASFANFFANVFNDPVGAIIQLFADMFDFIAGIIQSAAKLIDTVLGSDISSAVEGFRNDFANAVTDIVGDQTVVMEKLSADDYQFKGIDYLDAFGAGYDFGEKIDEKIKNFDLSELMEKNMPNKNDYVNQIAYNTDNTAKNTDKIAKQLEITSEDLKYIRDIAERDIINRFTTAEIKVDMTNHNSISNDMDLDGITEHLRMTIEEQMNAAAEGVY